MSYVRRRADVFRLWNSSWGGPTLRSLSHGKGAFAVLLLGLLVIKVGLCLVVKQSAGLIAYSNVTYLLLLLLSTAFAISNVVQNTQGTRSFWVLWATGCGLWSIDQWLWVYYELGLHTKIPDSSIADPALFLHVVPFMGALATLPHLGKTQNINRTTANSLLLLFIWVFLYAYLLFPYQYLFWDTKLYNFLYNVLYLIENLALIAALVLLALRAQAPWKFIYAHLFGASALYAFTSAVANFAIDAGRYSYTSFYALGQDAAVCWFVWVPVYAGQLPRTEKRALQSDANHLKYISLAPMLGVVGISCLGVWELIRRGDVLGIGSFRLLTVLVFVVFIALAVFFKEYVANRELVADVQLSEVQLSALVESAMDAIISINEEQRIVLFNASAQKMFGFFASEVIGQPLDRFIPMQLRSEHVAHIERFANSGITNRTMGALGVLKALRSDGQEFPIEASISQTRVAGRTFFTVIVRDVTERERHEKTIHDLSGRLIEAQEQERSSIARELHDDINQQVALLAIELQRMNRFFDDESSPGSKAVNELWSKTLNISKDIQQLSHELHSTRLEYLGIVPALSGLCRDFSDQTKMHADFVFRDIPSEIDPIVALSIFRVTQESLQNIVKHSHANKVRVEVTGTDKGLFLRISDNGIGFDPKAPTATTGLGMISMKERIRLLGGNFSVTSREPGGTQIEVMVPLDCVRGSHHHSAVT